MNLNNQADRVAYLQFQAHKLALLSYTNFQELGKGLIIIIATDNDTTRPILNFLKTPEFASSLKAGEAPAIYFTETMLHNSPIAQTQNYDYIQKMLREYNPETEFIVGLYFEDGDHYARIGGLANPKALYELKQEAEKAEEDSPFNKAIDLSIPHRNHPFLVSFIEHYWSRFAALSYEFHRSNQSCIIDIMSGDGAAFYRERFTPEQLEHLFAYHSLNPTNLFALRTIPQTIKHHGLKSDLRQLLSKIQKTTDYNKSLVFAVSDGDEIIIFNTHASDSSRYPKNIYETISENLEIAKQELIKQGLVQESNMLMREELHSFVRKHIRTFEKNQRKFIKQYGRGCFFITRENFEFNKEKQDGFAAAKYFPESLLDIGLNMITNNESFSGTLDSTIREMRDAIHNYNPGTQAVIVIQGDGNDLFIFKESFRN